MFSFLRRHHETRRENQRLLLLLEMYKRKCESVSEDVLQISQTTGKQLEDEIAKHNVETASWQNREKELCSIITDYHDSLKALEIKEQKWKDEMIALKKKMKLLKSKLKDKDTESKFARKCYNRIEQLDKTVEEKNEEIKNFKAKFDEAMEANSSKASYKNCSELKIIVQAEDDASGNQSELDLSIVSPNTSPVPSGNVTPNPSLVASSHITTWLSQLDIAYETESAGMFENSSPKLITDASSHLYSSFYASASRKVDETQWKWLKRNQQNISFYAGNELQILWKMYSRKIMECERLRLKLQCIKETHKIETDELLIRARSMY